MSDSQDSTDKQESAVCILNSKVIDDDQNTQLHYYAAEGLIEKVAADKIDRQKIDVKNYLGWTPLMMASRNGHVEMVKLLLSFGADPSRKNRFGTSVFLISITSGKLEVVQTLLEYLLCGGISKRSLQNVLSPLSLTILLRHDDIFEYLIKQKFDVNAITPNLGITPLMFAAAMEETEILNRLIKEGADISTKNHIGMTAKAIQLSKEKYEEPVPVQKPKPLTPAEMISKCPHMSPFHNPVFFVSPQQLLQVPSVDMRKSSNVLTPSPNCYVTTPNLTPISPMTIIPQVFFPQEFCPNQMFPVHHPGAFLNPYSHVYDLLNTKLSPSGFVISPAPVTSNGVSPCG